MLAAPRPFFISSGINSTNTGNIYNSTRIKGNKIHAGALNLESTFIEEYLITRKLTSS